MLGFRRAKSQPTPDDEYSKWRDTVWLPASQQTYQMLIHLPTALECWQVEMGALDWINNLAASLKAHPWPKPQVSNPEQWYEWYHQGVLASMVRAKYNAQAFALVQKCARCSTMVNLDASHLGKPRTPVLCRDCQEYIALRNEVHTMPGVQATYIGDSITVGCHSCGQTFNVSKEWWRKEIRLHGPTNITCPRCSRNM